MNNADAVIRSGIAALETLFGAPDECGRLVIAPVPVIRLLHGLLRSLAGDEPLASCASFCNALHREAAGGSLCDALLRELFDRMISNGVLPADLGSAGPDSSAAFLLGESLALWRAAAAIIPAMPEAERLHTLPAVLGKLGEFADVPSPAELAGKLCGADRFAHHRVFRFVRGALLEADSGSAKPLKDFFGFQGVRNLYADHFRDFRQGVSNLPLLVYSLPGYGKTSMTISHALADPETVLILPEPDALTENWHPLVDPLAARPDHKFVLFFDDIDPREVDWYNFRTNVGGAFSLPPNVMPVLASNYEFPAGILSRGRKITYPVFDELRCAEIIEDFLRDFGLKNPPPNLVAQLGADYTEAFGQKSFTELSPRTLMRHLNRFRNDRKKRRELAEMSMGDLISRPDPEMFYAFNIQLMRDLYGEEYIARLREEKLREL